MRKAIVPLVLIVALLIGFNAPVMGQAFANTFDHIIAQTIRTSGDVTVGDDLTVADDLAVGGALVVSDSAAVVGTFGVSGDLNVTDDVVIVDKLTVTGTTALMSNASVSGTLVVDSMTIAKSLNLTRQTGIAVTEGAVITPTGTFQELTAAGAVTATLADPASAGQTVILFNSTANAITILDGSGRYFDENIVLAAYDNVTLISTLAGSWMEIGRSDN